MFREPASLGPDQSQDQAMVDMHKEIIKQRQSATLIPEPSHHSDDEDEEQKIRSRSASGVQLQNMCAGDGNPINQSASTVRPDGTRSNLSNETAGSGAKHAIQRETYKSVSQRPDVPEVHPGTVVPVDSWRILFLLITEGRANDLMHHLKQQPYLNLLEVQDQLGFTLVNYAAFRNEASCVKVLYRYAKAHQVHLN